MQETLLYMVIGIGGLAAVCLLYIVKEIYSTNSRFR